MENNYWEKVYQSKQVDKVSWYQQQDLKRLALIQHHVVDLKSNLIDVGSGASLLIDQLIEIGYKNLYLLDLSETALNTTKYRLKEKELDAGHVQWQVADICIAQLPTQFFDLWHDRAVFHLMVTETQQQQYIDVMRHALKPNGMVMISTFAEDGPTQCSGLPVERYSVNKLAMTLGQDFQLIQHDTEIHLTPWGTEQKFLNTLWRFQG